MGLQNTFEIEIQKNSVVCFASFHVFQNSVLLFKFSYVFMQVSLTLDFYIVFSFYVLSILCFRLEFLFYFE